MDHSACSRDFGGRTPDRQQCKQSLLLLAVGVKCSIVLGSCDKTQFPKVVGQGLFSTCFVLRFHMKVA